MAYVQLICDTCSATWWAPDASFAGVKVHGEKCGGFWTLPDEVQIAAKDRKEAIEKGRMLPFRPSFDVFMWNRGKWRGWAVAVFNGKPLEYETHYKDGYNITTDSRFRQHIREGRVWVTDPVGALEFLQEQVGTHRKSVKQKAAIRTLKAALVAMEIWRDERQEEIVLDSQPEEELWGKLEGVAADGDE